MSASRILILILGMALGGAASWWLHQRPGPAIQVDEDEQRAGEQGASARRLQVEQGRIHLHLSRFARELAAIDSAVQARGSVSLEQTVSGRVSDRGALLTLLDETAAARAAQTAQAGVVSALGERRDRLRSLAARGEITVARELSELEVSYRREAASATACDSRVAALLTRMRTHWGVTIATAVDSIDKPLVALTAGPAQLIEFAIGAPPPAQIFVGADDVRDHAAAATVLGPAPAALAGAQQASWYALVASAALRVGMQVTVWIPQSEHAVDGAVLPSAALVWNNGVQWYFVELDPGVFERRRLPATLSRADGVLVPAGMEAGLPVVVRGAQALLAEELRQQIPTEDED